MRISKRVVTDIRQISTFYTSSDGVHGNSGSPVLNSGGRVVGLMRDMTDQAERSRATKYIGSSKNSRIKKAWEMLKLN